VQVKADARRQIDAELGSSKVEAGKVSPPSAMDREMWCEAVGGSSYRSFGDIGRDAELPVQLAISPSP